MPAPGGIALHAMRPTALAARLAFSACLGAAALIAHAQTTTALPEVTVNADAEGTLPAAQPGGQTARGGRLGLLGNTDTMKAPFSISSFTAKAIADQQAATAADIVTADSSVRFTGQTGGMFDTFYIRGFPIGEGNLGEVALDGFYGIAPNFRILTEYAERIEVLEETLEWQRGDFFAVPPMARHAHGNTGSEPALLFSVQDVPLLQAVGLYRAEASA